MLRMIRAALCVLLATAALSAQRPILPRPPAPDLVLFNGKVITVDRSFTVHQAVAIIGDRIMAVGNDDQMRTRRRPGDTHDRSRGPQRHPRTDGQPPARRRRRPRRGSVARRDRWPMSTRPSRRASRRPKPGDVIVSNSDWHEAQLKEQRLPLRDDLDRVAPSNPVVLVRGGHEYIVNSAALTPLEHRRAHAEPAGGRITKYPDGRLNGELVDTAKVAGAACRAPRRGRRDERIGDRRSPTTRS